MVIYIIDRCNKKIISVVKYDRSKETEQKIIGGIKMYLIRRSGYKQKATVNDINEETKERFFFMSHGINGIR